MQSLPVPESILRSHSVVLGKTRSGKSSLMRVIVEHLLDRNKRVVIIDPKGDWFGLKLSADGKKPGYPVIAFGDFIEESASDVPINEHSGRHVAELICQGNRPCVIGFRGWMPGPRTRFWIDFASSLFNAKSGELYVVGDEFHNFAPKGKVMDPEAGKSLHWSNRLLSEGAGLGLIFLIASQRPQKVHNDTLTCCETLFAMRVVHKADRDAIEDWVDGCGDPAHGKELLGSIASMGRGEAYVWSPEAGFGPKRVQFPLFKTFDSFAPPQLQKKIGASGWAGVDLDAVKSKLSKVIEEAKANDPRELKKEISRLKAELKDRPAAQPERIQVPVFDEETRRVMLATAMSLSDAVTNDRAHVKSLESLVARLESVIQKKAPPPPRSTSPLRPVTIPHYDDGLESRTSGAGLGRCERAILTALAQYPQGRAANQIAVLTGYSVGSGGFNNSLSKLRSAGYISRSQPIQITQEGLNALGDYDPLPLGPALVDHWLRRLPRCESLILKALLEVYPEGLSAEEVAERTGYQPSSGGFNNALSCLRTLELITRERPMRASEEFFNEP